VLFVWSYGADYGTFEGVPVEAYLKDLPLTRVAADVLIAYEMNSAPPPPEHGFPARLAPGFYGTNSVKWLTQMTLTNSRAPGPFTTRWYNDPLLDGVGRDMGATTPVCFLGGWRHSQCVRAHWRLRMRRAEVEASCGHEWQRFSCSGFPLEA
jgi:DMSO/TMAO reductase YedYZ molybdopterin-dependent catalytic subunit